jgi:hypothetical protein
MGLGSVGKVTMRGWPQRLEILLIESAQSGWDGRAKPGNAFSYAPPEKDDITCSADEELRAPNRGRAAGMRLAISIHFLNRGRRGAPNPELRNKPLHCRKNFVEFGLTPSMQILPG